MHYFLLHHAFLFYWLINKGISILYFYSMNLQFCKNIAENEFEIVISGDIGEDSIGRYIAGEIRYLNSIGAKKITERINSYGGNVVDGFEIVDANINSTAIIETIVTGLASSTAGWIAASGTKGHRFIYDYAKGMIHDPSLYGNSIDELPEGKDRNALISIKDSISTILSNHSNLNKDRINQLMTEEVWFDCKTWVENGFADKVIATVDKPKLEKNYSMLQFMNACNNFNNKEPFNNKNNMDIKDLENKVESLNGVVAVKDAKISDLENKVSAKDNLIAEMENKVSAKDSEIATLKAKVAEFENSAKEAAVNAAIESGKFSEENREGLKDQIEVLGVENFNKMVGMITIPTVNVLNKINNNGGSEGEKKSTDQKLADEYQNLSTSNPAELQRIKIEEPSRFEKMLNAWNEA